MTTMSVAWFIWAGLGLFLAFLVAVFYAACVVASRADDLMEKSGGNKGDYL